MFSKKWAVLFAVLVVAGLVLAACPAPAAEPVAPVVQTVVVEVEKQVQVEVTKVVEKEVQVEVTPTPGPEVRPNVVRANSGGVGDVPSLDPDVAEDTSSITVVDNSFVGLTRLNEVTNELMPGMATDWAVSGDGKVYTYTLRTDVPWVKYDGEQVVKVQTCPDADGKTTDRMVTAQDFEYGILRALKPETASPYAYVLAFAIDGAADFNNGVFTDTAKVGVTAVDTTTLQIKTVDNVSYNPMIAGLWTAYRHAQMADRGRRLHRGPRRALDRAWFLPVLRPLHAQGMDPRLVADHRQEPILARNRVRPAGPGGRSRRSRCSTRTPAMAEYEVGNLDAAAVPSQDIDRVKSDSVLSEQLVIAPNFCTYYYGFNTTQPFVDDPRMRRALSMALDRQDLVDNVLKGGQEPAQWFARPGLVAAPTMADYPDLGIKFDAAKAKEELDAYLAEKGITPDQLDITLMFNTSSGHQKIAEWAQQQWKQNLGIDIKLTNQEWKVFLETIKSLDTPQIYRLGWCLDYPDANNFTREVFAAGRLGQPHRCGWQPGRRPHVEE